MTSPIPITLAVDCMGGDHGPRVTLAACRHFLSNTLMPVCFWWVVRRSLSSFVDPSWQVVAASEVVEMDDPLEVALRKKKTLPCAWRLSKFEMAKRLRRFLLVTRVPDGDCPLRAQNHGWH
jgi:fatty acid/phospholipid biosynthesis enzyme